MLRRKLFAQAIGDEVLLRQQAKLLLVDKKIPLDKADLEKIGRQYGVDMATCCYYESLLQSGHGLFKNKIDRFAVTDNVTIKPLSQKIKILLIPGMFYKEHPEMGGDGMLILSIAKQRGFDVQTIPVLSKGSMLKNVKIINEYMQQEIATSIWFVSISKGSGELRYYLQNYPVPASVKGCLSIAGIHQGSPHAIEKRSNRLKRSLYKLLCKFSRIDYQVLEELDPNHAIWKNKHRNDTLEYIHLVPIPLYSHLQALVIKRYERLLRLCYQPNDGIVPIADVNALPGKIYPLWGVDHFVRTSQISELLYKFFSYIAESENKL